MKSSVRFLLVSILAGAAVQARPALAQSSPEPDAQPAAESRGPTIIKARAAAAQPTFNKLDLPGDGPSLPPVVQPSKRHSTTLMIVGGAALLAGAIIGGDAGTVIMIGGAAVGIYGLYWFLN